MAGSQGLSARCLSAFAFLHLAVVRSQISCSDLKRISSDYGKCEPDKDLEHGKLIVMVQVGDGFTDFFENWYRFADDYINRDCMQILAVIDDQPTEDAMIQLKQKNDGWTFTTAMGSEFSSEIDKMLLNTGIKDSDDDHDRLELTHPYGSPEYKKSMSLRPRAVNHFLSKNCPIVFSDTDLIWRKDIFSQILHLNKGGTQNMYGFDDFVKEDKPAELCGGFLFMNPTAWTLKVAKQWSDELIRHPGTNQGPLNDIIKKVPDGYKSMVWLPKESYLNPKTAGSRDEDQVSIVHANWLVGSADKKKFLKDRSLWHVDDENKDDLVKVGSVADAKAMTIDSTGDAKTATHDSAALASPIIRHNPSPE